MFVFDMLIALVLALVVCSILVPSRRYRTREGGAAWVFFVPLLFLLIWTAGVWITPVGPQAAGVYWLTFVIPAVILLLLLLALSSPSKPSGRRGEVIPENAEEEAVAGTVIAFSVFFWLLLTFAAIAVLAGYM